METPRSALSPPDQSQQIRAVILQFLHDRLQLKLDKLKDDQVEARLKLQEEYLPLAWVADAARRVGQIQQVTHALKFSHPDARGSSENWLLRSTPPNWQSDPISPPLNIENVYSRRFAYRPVVRQRTRALRDFLKRMEKRVSTIDIRNQRAEMVGDIRDELFQFAAEIQALEPGWSDLPECRLHAAEKCWLDPGRAAVDEAFATQYGRGDWRDEISSGYDAKRRSQCAAPCCKTPNFPIVAASRKFSLFAD